MCRAASIVVWSALNVSSLRFNFAAGQCAASVLQDSVPGFRSRIRAPRRAGLSGGCAWKRARPCRFPHQPVRRECSTQEAAGNSDRAHASAPTAPGAGSSIDPRGQENESPEVQPTNFTVLRAKRDILRRLAVGCALVGDPELLFLDEPTTGLGPQSRRQPWSVLQRFRAAHGSILLTTHCMDEAQVLLRSTRSRATPRPWKAVRLADGTAPTRCLTAVSCATRRPRSPSRGSS